MRISLNWLKDYVDIDVSVDEFCQKLTSLGLEIESVERPGDEIQGVRVGRILSIEKHPDADKLVVCKTDVGEETPLQIVCGATNMREGDKVPTATVGGSLPGGFKIGRRKMRGVESQGMMCSASELGLGDDHSGLLILGDDAQIGEDAVSLLGLDDVIVEIEVTPNRNDWAGLLGVAREVAAAYGTEMRIPEIALKEGGEAVETLSSVTLEAPDLCPRYVGRVVRGVKIGPSPGWMQQRLVAAGQRPINNVVDITNYVLLETGHPLHAFDYDKLAENRIVVRRAAAGERIKTIDQDEHSLSDDMLVIADGANPVAVAGIMGGFDSEVTEATVNLFVESAYFAPSGIRKTSRTLNLSSESSQRFQRGADPEMARYAADRACQLVLDFAGGQLATGILDEYPQPVESKSVTLRAKRCNELLGVTVSPETQTNILTSLGFSLESQDADAQTFTVPTWRPDVTCEADLIEEIGRCFGFDNIPESLPSLPTVNQRFCPEYYRVSELRNYLSGIGLSETVTWSFGSDEENKAAALGGEQHATVPLANPLSENHATLRTSLIPSMLRTVSNALRKGSQGLRLYEIAPVFRSNAESAPAPVQTTKLVIALANHTADPHWSERSRNADIYDLKGALDALMVHLGASADYEVADDPTFAPGAAMRIRRKKAVLGNLGRITRPVAKNFEIDGAVYIAEIDLDALMALQGPPRQFEAISPFPPSLRDMALVVDQAVPADELRATAQQSGGKLLQSVAIFDVYEGEQVGESKKSVALSLRFQAMDRTLTDKDTQKAFDKIVKKVSQAHGAELR